MKIKVPVFIIISSALFLACNNERSIKAKIFERKKVGSNKLMIKYSYTLNEKSFTDSATLANTVIEGDSINIAVDPSEPRHSKYNTNQ